MSCPRCDRMLAGTALALLLAAPFGVSAQETAKSPAIASPATEASSPPAIPAGEPPAASINTDPAAPAAPAAVTEETAAPDPLASLDPTDRVVAEKICDLLAATPDKIFASKNEKAAVEKFYQGRNLAPLWLDKGIENARAKAVIARLKEAEADGLDASDYRTPDFAGLAPDAFAEADLKLTQAVLTFARHLQAGRFPYARLSHNIDLPQTPPKPAAILARMVDAGDAGKALDEFAPPHAAYQKLKAKLAEMRAKSSGPRVEIAGGPLLKLNPKAPVQDTRVPLLREKLGLSAEASDLAYDAALAAAVRKFQQANELPATGSLDARTVKALNAPVKDRQIDLVIANMERWRWYPRDLGRTHVIVNHPEFMLRVMHGGAPVWSTRIVIGDPRMPTPLLSQAMTSITVNPTWRVPPSMVNDYLALRTQDPTVLDRMGMTVSYSGGAVQLTQAPRDDNALGRIRFNIHNRFIVYQHDTPEKHMFAHEARAYSHGCMRVQHPAKYAEVLLNLARPSEHWTVERVTRMFGAGEQDIQLPPAAIWVHLTYQSAFVDDAGKLQTRRDVYNIDGRLIAAVKSERAIIEPAPDGKPAEVASTGGRRRAAAPPAMSFFESLFFGGRRSPPRPSHGINR